MAGNSSRSDAGIEALLRGISLEPSAFDKFVQGDMTKTAVKIAQRRRKGKVDLVLPISPSTIETADRLLAKLAKYLRDSRDRFTHQTWVGLLNYASTFVSDASGGAITALRRDPQGEFTYVEDGDERPLELASGQQLAILGVAIKLALAAAVGSRFEVLLLDEVAAAASDENALLLTTCLAKTGQQVLLVSHREADAAVANDVIAL
jgi:DNA repair exonuclease SbcCD ATPase subunit